MHCLLLVSGQRSVCAGLQRRSACRVCRSTHGCRKHIRSPGYVRVYIISMFLFIICCSSIAFDNRLADKGQFGNRQFDNSNFMRKDNLIIDNLILGNLIIDKILIGLIEQFWYNRHLIICNRLSAPTLPILRKVKQVYIIYLFLTYYIYCMLLCLRFRRWPFRLVRSGTVDRSRPSNLVPTQSCSWLARGMHTFSFLLCQLEQCKFICGKSE